MSSHYDTLGVKPGASDTEIRKAYLRRARALHPDKQQGRPPNEARRAAEAMQQVNVAWNVLSDSTKRAEYDQQFTTRPAARPAATPHQRQRTNPPPRTPPPDRPAQTSGQSVGRSIDDQAGDGSVSIWASLPVLIIVGIAIGIFVVTAFGGSDNDGGTNNRPLAPELDSQMRDEDCFVFVGNSIRIESCSSGRADAQVLEIVPDPGNCPADTEIMRQGDVVLCFQRLVPGSTLTVPAE